MRFPYEDIVHLPHHVSKKHPPMSDIDRAAQFAPFAALTGHDAAIAETARLTDTETALSDSDIDILNRQHEILLAHLAERPEVTFVYFVPDDKKAGGVYAAKTGQVKKIDEYERTYILMDNTQIPMRHLFSMDSDLFCGQEELLPGQPSVNCNK